MQFALLIYESPEAFATRKNDENDPYLSAWRAYYKALVDAVVYVGGDPLEVPATGVEEIKPYSTGEYGLWVRGGKEYRVTRTAKENLRSLAEFWIGTGALFLDKEQ